MNEEDLTIDDAIVLSLSDEIQRLQKELDEKPPSLENGASTTKDKQRLEVELLETQRALRDKVMERECLLEEKRVLASVAKAKELETIVIPEMIECPICLEDISNGERVALSCCGKHVCTGCQVILHEKKLEARMNGDKKRVVCPCCRTAIPANHEQATLLMMKRAEQGCSWSQFTLGQHYEVEGMGVNVDMQKASYWYRCAAEQGHALAQQEMGRFHLFGLGGCDESYATAEKFFTLSAAKNEPGAQWTLAIMMKKTGRYAEALQWATLSAAQGDCTDYDGKAEGVVASLYFDENAEGIVTSYARALYWRRKAAMAGDIESFHWVAHSIICFNRELFGVEDVGEHCEVLYWVRQGALKGCEKADEMKTKLESYLHSFCSGCKKPASGFPSKLKGCTRCLSAYYCSRKCQLDHWAKGHKLFCCDKNGKSRFSVFPVEK